MLAWGNPEDNWDSSPYRLGQKICSRFALPQLSGLFVRPASGGDIREQDKLDKTGHEAGLFTKAVLFLCFLSGQASCMGFGVLGFRGLGFRVQGVSGVWVYRVQGLGGFGV